MQLKNYSILSAKNALKLIGNRIQQNHPSRNPYLLFKQTQISRTPNHYFLYQDLTGPVSNPNLTNYPTKSSAIKASHKLAKNESLNPEKYQIGVNHNTAKGYWKKYDRIHSGHNKVNFLTPKSSDKIFKAYKNHSNLRKRNALNNYQKQTIHVDKINLANGAGNDIFSNQRAKKIRANLNKVTKSFLSRSAANQHHGARVFNTKKTKQDINMNNSNPHFSKSNMEHNHVSQLSIFKFKHNGPHRN